MSIVKSKSKKGVAAAKCGDCIHFKGVKKYEDVCSNIGIIATSKAPECYCPDLTVFRKISALPNIETMGEQIKDLSAKQCRILATLLIKQSKIKTNGFYFGQKVFVCLGEDYLSHYYKAFILDIDKEGDYLYLVSKLKNAPRATTLTFLKSSVLTQTEFNDKVIELAQLGRVIREKKELEHFRNLPISEKIDKNGMIDVSKLIRLDLECDVPTIDKAPKEKEKKKKQKIKDLADIVREPLKARVKKLKTHKED